TTVVSVSVLTLCAIAVERYFAICRPLKSRITLRKVTVTVLIIWVISAAMASPNLNNYVLEMFRVRSLLLIPLTKTVKLTQITSLDQL
ncbi:orexin receptor type 1, partial [Biomphalaria glabrata]